MENKTCSPLHETMLQLRLLHKEEPERYARFRRNYDRLRNNPRGEEAFSYFGSDTTPLKVSFQHFMLSEAEHIIRKHRQQVRDAESSIEETEETEARQKEENETRQTEENASHFAEWEDGIHLSMSAARFRDALEERIDHALTHGLDSYGHIFQR